MAIKRRNKISMDFSSSTMSDLVFLLLIFFMITSTLVSPNALKLMLPQSNSQTEAKAVTSISITNDLKYYVNTDGKLVQIQFGEIESYLQRTVPNDDESYVSIHVDKTVAIDEVVKIMNIVQKNKYKMILATSPED